MVQCVDSVYECKPFNSTFILLIIKDEKTS